MMIVLMSVIGLVMLGAGVMSVVTRSVLGAIIAAGVVSLFASVIFLVLAAPDVAMTEAAIGAGLSTVIFLIAVRRTGGGSDGR